jgi:hypothetical protein
MAASLKIKVAGLSRPPAQRGDERSRPPEQHLAAFIPQGYETRGRILESGHFTEGAAVVDRQSGAKLGSDRHQVSGEIIFVAICALN